MSASISIADQKIILKHYLGFFYTPITLTDIANYKKKYPEVKTSYIFDNATNLKKIGAYFLLLRGNEVYKMHNAYDLFNIYIGRDETNKNWLDLETPLLFLYYSAFTETNKKVQDIIGHIVAHRNFKKLITIVLTEMSLQYVKDVIENKPILAIEQLNDEFNFNTLKQDNKIINPPIKKTKAQSDPYM